MSRGLTETSLNNVEIASFSAYATMGLHRRVNLLLTCTARWYTYTPNYNTSYDWL
jgi:hypothetical protein